ncbi:RlpA-like double-psi beta-barrel-protein domain-containing protein-containing protein [Microdochium trichocladiopsis]|uniref:Cellulase n=1 Tax=Microdochium trichocladiopsis TaxID=1682393 RepID=A0A9P9BMB7_9PEZI|nr:RlpA-like double-psi beta-barrel-protein domain-containing protein-containing protein [Microdochium trichocladiopsis]KAH7016270.1 RlpA-like double-psi beta-barrel-protein domain-containing protein-containing protein [Microdochium trichocladiopsis]
MIISPTATRAAVVLLSLTSLTIAATGSGHTTRYWDCCKPSCSWYGKANVNQPVETCEADNSPLNNPNAWSGCDGGPAFTCANMSPWAVNNNLAYGFAATTIQGHNESSWCCACYKLQFTSGNLSNKTMIVQATNTGSDLVLNQFDLLVPGGGVGAFDGCREQYGGPFPGQQYGGVSLRSECDSSSMPAILKGGCNWRFDWFMNADNPTVNFKQVKCPNQLTEISGCVRDDDWMFPIP